MSSARRRWSVAVLIVTTVSLTRVALGVHYLVDVLAGGLIGLAFVDGFDRLLPRYTSARPTVGFGLAVCFAAGTLAVGGLQLEGLVVLGATLGLFAGWQLVVLGRRLRSRVGSHAGDQAVGPRAFLAAVAMVPLWVTLEVVPLHAGPTAAAALGVAILVFVTIPPVCSPTGRRLAVAVRFWSLTLVRGIRRSLSRAVPSTGDDDPR